MAPADKIQIDGYSYVRWFKATDAAGRGFCSNCGSSLFFKMCNQEPGKEIWAIAAGAFETPVPPLAKHIFVADKGAYYEITDDLPQYDTFK